MLIWMADLTTAYRLIRLKEKAEQADNHSKESHTFDQGGCNNHIGTDVTRSLRLAGNGLHSGTADTADADARTNCGNTCAKGDSQLCNTCRTGSL